MLMGRERVHQSCVWWGNVNGEFRGVKGGGVMLMGGERVHQSCVWRGKVMVQYARYNGSGVGGTYVYKKEKKSKDKNAHRYQNK